MAGFQIISNWLAAECHRWWLWVPVLFGSGIAWYFALPYEPAFWPLTGILGLPMLIAWGYRRDKRRLLVTALCGLLIGSGFVWAKLYTDSINLQVLQREVPLTSIKGRVVVLDQMPGALRITLDKVEAVEPGKYAIPKRVRLKLRGENPAILTGDWIEVRAGFLPPSGPVMPGGFDFARFFFFRKIGAVGYALPPARILETHPPSALDELGLWWLSQRKQIVEQIRNYLPQREGAVAAALMVGDRTGIDDETLDNMRYTNLLHLLAISGMHMAIITGMVFFAVRFLLVLAPRTQHYRFNKQIAALVALAVGAAYLCVAAFPISAMRAYVMVALVFGAILIHRQVMPMRSLALAAMLLLLYNPANILEPGFQLSFAATCALIAFYETIRPYWDTDSWRERWWQRVTVYMLAVMATTIVAELATGPLVIHHFNNFSLYGIVANMLVMPLVTLLIMPAMLIGFILLPFDAAGPALWAMGLGVSWMLDMARWVVALPNSTFFLPSLTSWGLVVALLGMLWLCLWQRPIRYIGAVGYVIGVTSIVMNPLPDLFVSRGAKEVVVRESREWKVLKGRSGSFVLSQWAAGLGYKDLERISSKSEQYNCDALGCVYQAPWGRVALPKRHGALTDDCAMSAIVIAPFSTYKIPCDAYRIDRYHLSKYGTHWLWLDEQGNVVRRGNEKQLQGKRPWTY